MKIKIIFFLFPFRGHTIQALKIIEKLHLTGMYEILVDYFGEEYEKLIPKEVRKHECLQRCTKGT